MIGYGYSYFVSTILDTESGTAPVNTVAPAITGTAQEGQTVSCSTGTWTGTPTITYAYQWKRNGSNIGSATNSTYLLVSADVGQSITCQVTATNGAGSASATSNTITPIAAVDPDAQAFITAASITDPTQQSAINQLVVDLKGYNVWSKMKALYPFVGGTASAHKFNLKDPRDLDAAFRLVFNGGWTHSNLGATPNGVNAFADTKFIPNSNITVSSGHFSVYNRNNDLVGTKIDGVNSGSTWIQMNHSYGDFIFGQIASYASYTPTDTRGLFLLTRTANNLFKIKRNATNLLTNTGIVTSLPTHSIYIGARNDAGSYNHQNSYQKAFASIGDGLTDTEAANFYTAVQSFQTTLGRSIGTQTVSDADAQAFVTNAGIVDQVEANAINNLVIGLKADGLWTKMKAVYPFVGGTSTTNSYNLKNTAQYQISWNGGWTWNSNGVTGNGSNSFANTGFNPNSAFSTNDSAHLSIYSRTNNSASAYVDFGATNGLGSSTAINSAYVNNAVSLLHNGSAGVNVANFNTQGFYIGTRSTASIHKLFKNGSQLGTTDTTSSGTRPNFILYLGAYNSNGSNLYHTNRNYAFASIGDGLSDAEATNFYNRVQTFNTALNRNV